MTPRRELLERAGEALWADNQMEALETLFNKFSIGKWVPVSERMPKFDENGRWAGCFQSDTNTYFGVFTCHVFKPGYHWLELDIPEVER